MSINYSKLLGRMREYGYTIDAISKKMNIHSATLSAKLKGRSFFDVNEILRMAEILEINSCDLAEYFFNAKV